MRLAAALTLSTALAACGRSGLEDRLDDEGPEAGGRVDAGADVVARAACVFTDFVEKSTPEPTGKGPGAMAAADFDGDGRLDLAIANWGGVRGSIDGSASVFLANGPGTFAAQTMYPTEIQPGALAAGDLTGDGRPEVAVVNNLGSLNILLNEGGGKLRPLPRAPTISSATALAIADLDGDGRADLAVASDDDAIVVHPGKGDGTFGAGARYPTGSMPFSLVAADVDGDGDLDLVATNVTFPPGAGLPVGLGPGNVSVLLNRGAGTFAPQVVYPAGTGTFALAVGDADGDGDLDLAVTNSEDSGVAVLRNAGDGTFGRPETHPTGERPGAVSFVDLDRDGDLDLVSTSDTVTAGAAIVVLFNLGVRFSLQTFDSPSGPTALVARDFDGDGIPDLALTSTDGNPHILLGDCR